MQTGAVGRERVREGEAKSALKRRVELKFVAQMAKLEALDPRAY
jgi:hypothetical protein